MTLRAISLFSGVGGFELGLERAGIQTLLCDHGNDPELCDEFPCGVEREDDF